MILTKEERDKFALYLEETAASNKALEQQLDILPGGNLDALRKQLRLEEMSARVIAKKLRETHSEKI